jgi:hypothetical protein
MVLLLDFGVDEIAILRQFTDEWIDLTQCQLGPAFEKTADKTVFINAEFECGRAGMLDSSDTELLGQGEYAQNAANAGLSLMPVNGFTECADMRPGTSGASQ